MEKIMVNGVASKVDEAQVTIHKVPDKPGVAAGLFNSLASAKINVDMIVQSSTEDVTNDISFTVKKSDLKTVQKVVEELKKESNADGISIKENIGIVSIVGVGMKSHTGIASRLFEVLAEAKINISMISTSEIKISVVIEESQVKEAMNIIHAAFELDKAS